MRKAKHRQEVYKELRGKSTLQSFASFAQPKARTIFFSSAILLINHERTKQKLGIHPFPLLPSGYD